MRNWQKVVGFASLFAQACAFAAPVSNDLDLKRARAVRDYVEARRDVELKVKGGKLIIGGEVTVSATQAQERINGHKVRGKSAVSPFEAATGNNAPIFISKDLQSGVNGYSGLLRTPEFFWDVNAKLSFDYEKENSYAAILLQFANVAGLENESYQDIVGAGIRDHTEWKPGAKQIALKKALIGHKFHGEGHDLALEIGRQSFYNIFLSRIQYTNRFDGVVARYKRTCGNSWYTADGAVALIDARINHYIPVVQLGAYNIGNLGFYAIGSYIDWTYSGTHVNGRSTDGSTENVDYKYLFRNSQMILGRHIPKEYLGVTTNVMVGGIYNHKAEKQTWTSDKKRNTAYWAGAEFGELKGAGSWKFGGNYQYCEMNAVPDFDCFAGITMGNVSYYPNFTNGDTLGIPKGTFSWTNFKGPSFDLSYGVDDNQIVSLKYSSAHRAHLSDGKGASVGPLVTQNSYHRFGLTYTISM